MGMGFYLKAHTKSDATGIKYQKGKDKIIKLIG